METVKKSDGFASQKLIVLPDYVVEDMAQNELIRDLYITEIGFFPHAEYHYRERPEGSDALILIFCVSGSGFVQLQNEPAIHIHPYSVFVIPAGIPHRYGASEREPWSIYWLHFKGNQAAALMTAFGLHDCKADVPLASCLKFVELFEQCCATLQENSHSTLHLIQLSQKLRYMLSILSATSARNGSIQRREKYLAKSIQYMNERLDRSLSLSELAKFAGLSKPHLIHLFKQTVGYPPIDYFLRLKMKRAGQLLDLSSLSVKEISAAVGVTDPLYFSRIFKKVMGHSPSVYRRMQKG